MASRVAVVLFHHTAILSDYELISLRRLQEVFTKRPIYLIHPRGMSTEAFTVEVPDINLLPVDPSWMKTYRDYNRLKLSSELYEKFIGFDYMLCVELDAFVFKDNIDEWIASGYSYIGAPWVSRGKNGTHLGYVGNGGFSLRKVDDHLRVVRSWKKVRLPANFPVGSALKKLLLLIRHEIMLGRYRFYDQNTQPINEDLIWCTVVPKQFSWFTIPDASTAVAFSIEKEPRYCMSLLKGSLPTGCHAWWRYDLEFWKPVIEGYGYDLKLEK